MARSDVGDRQHFIRGSATGVAFALSGWSAWLLGSLAFTLVYVTGVGAEIGFAAHQHPAGGVEGEQDRAAEQSASRA